MKSKKKILIIGSYDKSYQRNKVLIKAFKDSFETKEACFFDDKKKQWLFLKTLLKARNKYDYIFVVREGQAFAPVLLIYKLFFHSKIILDAFYSLYDTYVFDRKLVKEKSLKAKYYYFIDWLSCRVADILIFDTDEHRKYFKKTFNIQNKKEIILPVPIDIEQIAKILPKKRSEEYRGKFIVLFYGYYIPLQGVEYIIEVAKELQNIKKVQFLLIGSGQTREKLEKEYKKNPSNNIEFIDRIEHRELIAYIKMADLNLGIFGNTDKAKRVIPNKVLDAVGAGKVVLTGQNKAMQKHFQDKKDLVYCNMADVQDLAEKIEYVYNNYKELEYLGENGGRKVEGYFSEKKIKQIIEKEIK